MKLIPMTDFVLEQGNQSNTVYRFSNKVLSYAKFLKQPLELGMFVPCDEEGNVLEKPHNFGLLHLFPTGDKLMDASFYGALQYQKAKEKVLFDDVVYDEEMDMLRFNLHSGIYIPDLNICNIERLTCENITLTESAIKQLKL